jgi:CRP-like cAMP-binding protein
LNFERIKADNRIFRALSPKDWAAWLPYLEPVSWDAGTVVAETVQPIPHVVFPARGVLTLQAANLPGVNLAMIGREGFVDLAPSVDSVVKSYKVVAAIPGEGCRMDASRLRAAMAESGEVLRLLLQYQHVLTVQMMQTAVCRNHHTLEQQLCRWLLMEMEWFENQLCVMPTHLSTEFVGQRPEDIQAVVHSLQEASLIECDWPRVSVSDREGLAQRCCDCYDTIKREYQLL